jgi:hypothetical protein
VRDDYQTVNERAVFNSEAINRATGASDKAVGRAAYRRYMVAHLWEIWQNNCRVHDMKSDAIKSGQRLFVWFLGAMIVVGVAMAISTVIELAGK